MRDLQRRLASAGFADALADHGTFGEKTAEALRAFQADRGLTVDGVCGPQTWSALVEAGYRPGDRLLYRRNPMLRGEDVADLQRRLSALGFDIGKVDGIFGPDTERAVLEFQRNSGLTADGICGPDTLTMLARLGDRTSGDASGARLRQIEALRDAPRTMDGCRLAVGVRGGLDPLALSLGTCLRDAGASVIRMPQADDSDRAAAANRAEAHLYISFETVLEPDCRISYFSTVGYESLGGRRLAELLATELPPLLGLGPAQPEGKRLPLLRETRMPAVVCHIGPAEVANAIAEEIAAAVARALRSWVLQPAP